MSRSPEPTEADGGELRVDSPAGAGRLDSVLAALWPDFSRSQWARWVQEGRVDVDGKTGIRPGVVVRPGSRIEARVPPPAPVGIEPRPVPFAVLHEDRDVLVVDKPAGLVVHPGARAEPDTLVHGLLLRWPDLQALADSPGAALRPGIVHRLDRGTSGLMVIARSARARLSLIEQFQRRSVDKEYRAWCFGELRQACRWEGPIARHPRDRKRFAVVDGGKPARTDAAPVAAAPGATALTVRLWTGRTHQIRVHAHHAGFPLLGDPVYRRRGGIPGRFADWSPERDRPALHAWRLGFEHPGDGRRMAFEAPLPEDLAELDRRFQPC